MAPNAESRSAAHCPAEYSSRLHTLSRRSRRTTTPNGLCAPIHNRMPVILDRAAYPIWLGEDETLAGELEALLRPLPVERMRAYPIGQRVGNGKSDDASRVSG
jgi:putative SOS response-associated peptidase YedK